MPRWAKTIEQQLGYVAGHPGLAQRHAFRARLVAAVRVCGSIRAVAAAHNTTRATVAKWSGRVAAAGIEGLLDAPRSGRPRLYGDDAVRDLLTVATSTRPGPYALWSHRALREAMWELNWGVTCSWISAHLSALGLRVHRVKGWIGRRDDPDFDAKVAAVQQVITGAGASPYPVLSLDEKTAHPIRTPTRPDTRGRDGTLYREFEYVRKGTISWYGVQDCATGAVRMIRARERMNSEAFIDVLAALVTIYGDTFTIILDNGSAHTSRATRAWLQAHPGIHVLHTPAHASWVNPIESVFGILARQVLKHAWFEDPDDCDTAVQAWIDDRNRQQRPVTFTWQAAA